MFPLNNALVEALNAFALSSPVLADVTRWIADRLDMWVIVLLLAWFMRRAWITHQSSHKLICFSCFHEFIFTVVTGFVAWAAAIAFKSLFTLARPFLVTELDITPLFTYGAFDTFPSGHAALFMALGLIAWFHDRVVGVVVLFSALLIGIARVMSGVHFPLDILGGYLLGILVVVVIMGLDRKHLHRS